VAGTPSTKIYNTLAYGTNIKKSNCHLNLISPHASITNGKHKFVATNGKINKGIE